MNTPEENQFDDLLRDAFAGFRAQPDAVVWQDIQRGVRPQPPTLWQRLRPVGAGMVLGALLTGVWPYVSSLPPAAPAPKAVAGTAATPPAGHRPSQPEQRTLMLTPTAPTAQAEAAERPRVAVATPATTARGAAHYRAQPVGAAGAVKHVIWATTAPVLTASLPMHSSTATRRVDRTELRPEVALAAGWRRGYVLDTALHTALRRQGVASETSLTGRTASVTDTTSRGQVRQLLLTEAIVLQQLKQRNDSLLRTLEEAPRPLALGTDSVQSDLKLPPPRPWALTVASELMGGWGTMPGFNANATEKLRVSQATAVLVSHQLTDRWRLRAGVGESVVRTQLSYQQEVTGQTVRFDTTRTTDLQVHESVDTTYLIQIKQVMRLDPHYNNIGQVIYYDTTYVPTPDTIYQVMSSHDTIRTHQTLVTRHVDTWRDRRQQTLRPEYRFWTIPVAAQYALLVRGHLRLGVSAGGQVLIFRGGARPVLRDGSYTLQQVGPRDGPFRPVSVAWQGSADLEWRFSPRLSATVAPGMRGWVVRPERGLNRLSRPLPSVQLGITWGF